MPRGRPTDRTPENAEIILKWLAVGRSYHGAAGKAGLCRDTLNEWRRDDADFSDRCQRARAAGIAHLEDEYHATRNPVWAKTRGTLLACYEPDELSVKRKMELSGSLSVSVQQALAAAKAGTAIADAGAPGDGAHAGAG